MTTVVAKATADHAKPCAGGAVVLATKVNEPAHLLFMAPPMADLRAKFGALPKVGLPSAVHVSDAALETATLRNKALAASLAYSKFVANDAIDLCAKGATGPVEMAICQQREFETLEAYDALTDADVLAEPVGEAFALIASLGEGAKDQVMQMLDKIHDDVKEHLDKGMLDAERAFLALAVPDGSQYDHLYMLSSPDEVNGGLKHAAVGFLGAMVTVYDATGGTYQIDEPATWGEYLRSRWKDEWTQALIKEVTKLEELGTWVRVPKSWAKGHHIHRCRELFKVKFTESKTLDKLKVRVTLDGSGMQKFVDYLEHFASGTGFGTFRMLAVRIREDQWITFAFDVTNAFPREDIDRKTFMHLPRGPFDWKDPVTGEEQVAYVQKNLYGTPSGPRTFTKGATKYHLEIGFHNSVVEQSAFERVDEHKGVKVGLYVDEGFGGASDMDTALWYRAKLMEKYELTWRWKWENLLGFGVEDEPDKPLAFTSTKYVRSMMDKFLPSEKKQDRKTASRETIMDLPDIELPPLGSPDDLAMRGMQEEGRSLCGAIGHLARGRLDVMLDHALAAQCMARMSYEARDTCLEILRYANAVPMKLEFPSTVGIRPARIEPSLYKEPIRPYEETIDFDLWGIGDVGMKKPSSPKGKSMGGFAIMYGGGALEAKSYRFHTVITDSTSGETCVASRLAIRLIFYRRLSRFFGNKPLGPTPLFTDNDGTWHIARDGASSTRMTYVINHVRLLQQTESDEEIRTFQVDRAHNPGDVLVSWRDAGTRARHYTLLMGNPAKARAMWLNSSAYKQWRPAKIVPVPTAPPAMPTKQVKHVSWPADSEA